MIEWLIGVKIITRPDQLIIEDRRPTWPMLLSMLGTVFFTLMFALRLLFGEFLGIDSTGMWMLGIPAVVCVGLSFRGTIREQYVFDRPSDTYHFVRQFLYKKEVIEGTLSQFRGVGVKRFYNGEYETDVVMLVQGGVLFGSSSEQPLRESKPAFNFWNTEARIAESIHKFLRIPRVDGEPTVHTLFTRY